MTLQAGWAEVLSEVIMIYRKKGIAKVLSDKIIQMEYYPEDETGQEQMKITNMLSLRKVCYQDDP